MKTAGIPQQKPKSNKQTLLRSSLSGPGVRPPAIMARCLDKRRLDAGNAIEAPMMSLEAVEVISRLGVGP